MGESRWISGEEGRSGMGHLHEKFFLEEGAYIKRPKKEALLCGCQKAQGGCCKCLNSHAKHIQLCCPSNNPDQDKQTVRCLQVCNYIPPCLTLSLELVHIFNDWRSTMLPGLTTFSTPEDKVVWLSTGVLQKLSIIPVLLLKVLVKI